MQTEQIEEYVTLEDGLINEDTEQNDENQQVFSLEEPNQSRPAYKWNSKSSFIDGLSVGLGAGIIASFAILWASLFFSPLLPQSATYESLLASYIYPLYFLLGTGLVALTAGIIREYYSKTRL